MNTAARIASHAGTGQILVSDNVLRAAVVDGVSFVEIGEVELTGISQPVLLHDARRGG